MAFDIRTDPAEFNPDLYASDGKFRFVAAAARGPAWHKLGTIMEGHKTPTEAMKLVDGGVQIVKVPLTAEHGGTTFEVPNRVALFRDADGANPAKYIATVGKDFPFFQTDEIAAMLDPFSDGRQAKWPCETFGLLGDGRTVFFTLHVGQFAVKGADPVEHYLLATERRDGTGALEIADVTERVVCRNTLRIGLGGAISRVTIPHVGRHDRANAQFASDAEFYVGLMAKLMTNRSRIVELFDALADKKVSPSVVDRTWKNAYPVPEKPKSLARLQGIPDTDLAAIGMSAQVQERSGKKLEEWRYAMELTHRRRVAVDTLYQKFNDEQPKFARTGWAVLNAVTEFEDHRVFQNPTNSAYAVVWGDRASTKERVLAQLVSDLRIPVGAG